MKNFGNVNCVVTNHNNVKDNIARKLQNHKLITIAVCCFGFPCLIAYFLETQ